MQRLRQLLVRVRAWGKADMVRMEWKWEQWRHLRREPRVRRWQWPQWKWMWLRGRKGVMGVQEVIVVGEDEDGDFE